MLGRYLRFARFEFLYPTRQLIAIARVVKIEKLQSAGRGAHRFISPRPAAGIAPKFMSPLSPVYKPAAG
jgi:hypothetical protein